MSTQKLTRWFSADTTCPARPGVYEIQVKVGALVMARLFSHWNGEWWGFRMHSKRDAMAKRRNKAVGPVARWRGLVENPAPGATPGPDA